MDPATELNSEDKPDLTTSAEFEEVNARLSQIVDKSESEENIEKLARILEAEWKTAAPDDKTPDLSFKKFEEKLKSSRNQ